MTGGGGPWSCGSVVAIGRSNPCSWSKDRGPSKTNQSQLCRGNAISKTWVRDPMPTVLGSWLQVHGPRRDGAGTPGQVLCSGMGGILSFDKATKPPCTAQARFV